ncbi:MAG: hypothetical protein H7270_07750 [Dermatophilaceae bacterium]|nr:hypothetical protein [Dermatophilaceae bacterium]
MTTDGHPCVLVLALGRDPLPAAVTEAAARWEAAGSPLITITLTPRASLTPTSRQVALVARPLGPDGADPSTAGAPRSTARKALRRLHLDPVRWPAAFLLLVSPRSRRLLADADVVLAADSASVLLGWALALRRGEGRVLRSVSGVDRALRRTTQI